MPPPLENSKNSIVFTVLPSSPPKIIPLVLLDAPGIFLLLAVASPKSVALPKVAVVIKSNTFDAPPESLLGPKTHFILFEFPAIKPVEFVKLPKSAALPVERISTYSIVSM